MLENKIKYQNLMGWLAIIVLSAFSCIIYLKYKHISTPIKLSFWLIWFLVTLGLLSMTNLGMKMWGYFLESRDEMRKVHWPSRQETLQTTLIIAVFVFVISMILWFVDTSMLWFVGKLTHLYR